MDTVSTGMADKKAAATRAPRIWSIDRRVSVIGNRMNHATQAPQIHPLRFARSAPESKWISGDVMLTQGPKNAMKPSTAPKRRTPLPRRTSNHGSASRCGCTGMPKSSSAIAS
jgi:hypothetical protein